MTIIKQIDSLKLIDTDLVCNSQKQQYCQEKKILEKNST